MVVTTIENIKYFDRMLTRQEEADLKKEIIIKAWKSGKHTKKEIADKIGVTIRWVQVIIKDELRAKGGPKIFKMHKYGKTSEVKIFSVKDILFLYDNPHKLNEVINDRYYKYYQKQLKRLRSYESLIPKEFAKKNYFRYQVLNRDDCKCVICGSSIAIEVHHKKPVRLFPELEYDLKNAETVCHNHHTH